MSDGLNKKHSYEKQNRPAPGNFNRRSSGQGQALRANQIKFTGEPIPFDPRSLYMEDLNSLIGTLEGWRFTVSGQTGTIGRLRKIPEVAAQADELFEATRRSIFRMDEISQSVKHPDKERVYNVMEFQCFIPPADPFPEPIFKKHLAFSAKLPGPG